MADALYNLSLQVPDLLILIGCALLFGLAGVLITILSHRLWWSRMAKDKDATRDVGDGVHSSILALTAFLLALITTSELSSFGNTDRQITAEALAIKRLDRELGSIGQEGVQGQKLLRTYVNSVVTDEWPRLARRPASLSPVTDGDLMALWAEVRRLQPVVKGINPNLGGDLGSYFHSIEDARVSRLSASADAIPDVVWLMIGLYFFSASLLAGRHQLTRYGLQVVFIQMSALGMILALDIIIDNPFGGDTSLGPERILAAVSSQ